MQRPGRAPRQTWRRRAGGSGAGQSPGGPPADVAVQSWWTRPGRALGGRSGAALEAAGQGTDGDRARRSGGPVGATFDGRARNAPGPSRSAERDGAGLARWMGWARGVDGHSSDVDARESARSGPPCDRPNARARQPSLNPAALAVAGTNRAHVGGGAVDRTPCVAVPLHGTRRSAQQTGVRWRGRVGGASCAGRSTKRARRWPGNALEERPYQQRQRMRAGAAPDAGGSSAGCGREQRRMRAGAAPDAGEGDGRGRARATDAGRRATRAWGTPRAPPGSLAHGIGQPECKAIGRACAQVSPRCRTRTHYTGGRRASRSGLVRYAMGPGPLEASALGRVRPIWPRAA